MSLILITGPTATPISIQEIRAQCRVDSADEDALLMAYVRSATDAIEEMTGLRLLDQTWEYSIDAFPARCGWIRLPLAPLLALVSIVYQDSTGTVQTLSVDIYLIRGLGSAQPAQLILAPGKTWPSTWHGLGSVMIRFRAGWVDWNGVPEALRQAVMMLACHWFENRSTTAAGPNHGPVSHVPFGVRELIEPYRIWAI
jgi:uncharacterized phiE125 gp8 family phage protein